MFIGLFVRGVFHTFIQSFILSLICVFCIDIYIYIYINLCLLSFFFLSAPLSPCTHICRNARLREIERLRWDFGSILPASMKSKLSPSENQFYSGYNQLLNTYMASTGIDLTEVLRRERKKKAKENKHFSILIQF